MEKLFSRILGLIAVVVLVFGVLSSAYAVSATPFERMEIVVSNTTENSLIDVKASLSNEEEMPNEVSIIYAADAKLMTVSSFDPENPSELAPIDYKVEDLEDGHKAFTVTLVEHRGIHATFSGPALAIEESGHLIMGLSWMPASDVKQFTMATVPPRGFDGIGKGVGLLGTTNDGGKIFGHASQDVKAGEEQYLAVAFMPTQTEAAPKEEGPKGPDPSKIIGNNSPSTTTYIIYALVGVILIAVIVLIVVIVKSRKSAAYDEFESFDELDEEESEYLD